LAILAHLAVSEKPGSQTNQLSRVEVSLSLSPHMRRERGRIAVEWFRSCRDQRRRDTHRPFARGR
jgi:hypothetical protein